MIAPGQATPLPDSANLRTVLRLPAPPSPNTVCPGTRYCGVGGQLAVHVGDDGQFAKLVKYSVAGALRLPAPSWAKAVNW
jgi:hypothetical protein